MKLKKKEINDLLISWLTISLAFTWVFSNFNLINLFKGTAISSQFIEFLPISLIATGTGFIFHELAHRYTAIHFGAHAEYRMWPHMLFLAAIFSFLFGFVFAAPGAVYIYGQHISRKQNGLISLAGPATNIFIAIIFLILFTNFSGWIANMMLWVAYINFFLGLFNLLPIGPLDGSKVFKWNPIIWSVFFIPLAIIFLFLRF
jgi:Zn-dependent protease